MTRKTQTVRGRLYRTPLATRHRLEYVRVLLDWAYGTGRSKQDLRGAFWTWYCGVYQKQAMRKVPGPWKRLMQRTVGWDWATFQGKVRETIEAVLRPKGKPLRLRPVAVARGLGIWEADDGKRYFHYSTQPPPGCDPDVYVEAAIDLMLSDLHGLSTEVMDVCQECGRLFVRLRPTRTRYCSASCRGRAFMAKHGYRPRRRRIPAPLHGTGGNA